VWHFTRFQLTVCSHGSSAVAELYLFNFVIGTIKFDGGLSTIRHSELHLT